MPTLKKKPQDLTETFTKKRAEQLQRWYEIVHEAALGESVDPLEIADLSHQLRLGDPGVCFEHDVDVARRRNAAVADVWAGKQFFQEQAKAYEKATAEILEARNKVAYLEATINGFHEAALSVGTYQASVSTIEEESPRLYAKEILSRKQTAAEAEAGPPTDAEIQELALNVPASLSGIASFVD